MGAAQALNDVATRLKKGGGGEKGSRNKYGTHFFFILRLDFLRLLAQCGEQLVHLRLHSWPENGGCAPIYSVFIVGPWRGAFGPVLHLPLPAMYGYVIANC